MRNYYELLGISINASEQEIKEAYHRQARKYHPDNNPGQDTTEMMQELTLAYNTLRNTSSRRQYDATLNHQQRTSTSYSTRYSSKTPNTDDFWSAVNEYMKQNQDVQKRMRRAQEEREERMRKAQQEREERMRKAQKEREERIRKAQQKEMKREDINFDFDNIPYNINNNQNFIKPDFINFKYDIKNNKPKVKVKNIK